MDFKRVENILIVAFLLVNIFLASILINRAQDSQASTVSQQEISVLEEMANRNIDLPELTENTPQLTYLQSTKEEFSESEVESLPNQTGSLNAAGNVYSGILSEPLELSSSSKLTDQDLRKIESFMQSDAVIYGEEYSYFYFDPVQSQAIYTQGHNGIPIADGTASVTFHFDSNHDILAYDQSYAGELQPQGRNLILISEREAVEILFQNNKLPSNSSVSKPRLSYFRTLDLDDISMYAPVWFVQVTTGNQVDILRVDAATGSVLPSNVSAATNIPSEEADIQNNQQ